MNLSRQRALMTCLLLPIYQVTITLNICTTLATAMGAQINRHLKVLGTGIFSTLADAKVTVLVFFFPTVFGRVDFLIKTAKSGNYYNNTIVLLEACYKQKSSLPN